MRCGDGGRVVDIGGQFSLRGTYAVSIDGAAGTVPTEAVLAAACILDALENQSPVAGSRGRPHPESRDRTPRTVTRLR